MTFWCNGQLIEDDDQAVASIRDRGLLLGDGLFETVKIRDGRPLFLTEHLARLGVSALELSLRYDRTALRPGLKALIEATGIEEGSARITVTRGPGPRGLAPIPEADQRAGLFITVAAGSASAPAEPARLVMAPFTRASGAPSVRMKTLSYTDNLAARAHADAQGAADAIFLNERGEVTSTTMANLFVAAEDAFLTPPVEAGILPGIVREMILKYARRYGLPVREERLSLEDLAARPLFRTNSLMGVTPAWLDHGVGFDKPGGPWPDGLEGLYRQAEDEEARR